MKHRYIQTADGAIYDFWWVEVNGPSGTPTVVASAEADTPFVFEAGTDPMDMAVPDGAVETDKAAYDAAEQEKRDTRRADFLAAYSAAQERSGILQNLINGADDLLGGIL